MGRADFVKHGDYNVICDLCGFKYKASMCRKTWNNLYVCNPCWDPRHPQDFVTGITDDQSVPIARPDIDAPTSTTGQTVVATSGTKFDTTIVLASASGLVDGDPVGIVLDNGDCFWTNVASTPSGTTVTFRAGTYLPYNTASGNAVYLPSIGYTETFVTATTLTATGL